MSYMYEYQIDFPENGPVGTHFHMNCFAQRLVVMQRQKATRIYPFKIVCLSVRLSVCLSVCLSGVVALPSLCPQLFDTDSLRHMNTYKTERPVNSASLSPVREHVSSSTQLLLYTHFTPDVLFQLT